MVSIKLPAKDKQETFEAKFFFKLGQCFGNFTTGSFLCHLITVLARIQTYLLSLKNIQLQKVPNLFFAKSSIETIYMPVVLYIS